MTDTDSILDDTTIKLMRRIGPRGRMIVCGLINENVGSNLRECLMWLFPNANVEELKLKFIHAMYGVYLSQAMRKHIAAQSGDSVALANWKRGFEPFEKAIAEVTAAQRVRGFGEQGFIALAD